jgi:hypothetical protein
MKPNRIGTLIGSALFMSIGLIGMPGCSSTTTTDGGTDGGGTTEGGGNEGGGGDGGMTCPKDLKCATYCDFYSTTCAMNNGGVDKGTCNSLCKALTNSDMANLGTAADTSGDTLGCRLYHTCAASSGMTAAHCGHAGIWSAGDTCGTQCDAYCTINLKVCTGANAAFQGMNECLSKCGGWATTGKPGDAMGNTLQCREYHLGVASSSDMNAMTHCPHTGDVSSQCM